MVVILKTDLQLSFCACAHATMRQTGLRLPTLAPSVHPRWPIQLSVSKVNYQKPVQHMAEVEAREVTLFREYLQIKTVQPTPDYGLPQTHHAQA